MEKYNFISRKTLLAIQNFSYSCWCSLNEIIYQGKNCKKLHYGIIGKSVVCVATASASDGVIGDYIKTITWPVMKNVIKASVYKIAVICFPPLYEIINDNKTSPLIQDFFPQRLKQYHIYLHRAND